MVKRRRFSFFDDDFERMIERMFEEMTRGFEDFEELEKRAREGKSFVRGFSITIGPDGKPIIQEFGDKPQITPKGIEEKREPLVDIINEKNDIKIIAELPGVRKEDIELNATEKGLEIKVDTPERKYYKKLELPAKIKPETADAKYNNGVLEVIIKKVEPSKEEEKKKRINIK
ncbi:MAG: archaeal heat shock protein Hsp20 [Candidatus Micrarchaeia archaeon]